MPTQLIRAHNARGISTLLTAVTHGGAVLNAGCASTVLTPLFVFTSEPLPVPALRIRTDGFSQYGRLLASEKEKLSDYFQPQLLAFRLRRHSQISASRFDLPTLASETRLLAALGAAVEGSPVLQARLRDALRRSDEIEKAELVGRPRAAVLEVLLVACHDPAVTIDMRVSVKDVTRLTNTLQASRGEVEVISERKVGGILRTELDLRTERQSAGYSLTLNTATRRKIHHLASLHSVLSTSNPFPGCTTCDELCREQTSVDNLHHLHNLHNVH